MLLITKTKNQYSCLILDNEISSFYHSYSNNGDGLYDQLHHSNSSPSFTDPNYLQNQGSKSDTIIETEIKTVPKPPYIKRILLIDDDPDVTLTFKAGLDGHYYGDGDKKKRFEAYTYNDPLSVLKEFKPHFYDLLLTVIYINLVDG